jgi:hypothetical protein
VGELQAREHFVAFQQLFNPLLNRQHYLVPAEFVVVPDWAYGIVLHLPWLQGEIEERAWSKTLSFCTDLKRWMHKRRGYWRATYEVMLPTVNPLTNEFDSDRVRILVRYFRM